MNSWAELIGLKSSLGVFLASKGILDTQVENRQLREQRHGWIYDVSMLIHRYLDTYAYPVWGWKPFPRIHAYILSLFPTPLSDDAAAARETG